MSAILDDIAGAIGASNVVTDADLLTSYEQDGRQTRGRALAVARPGDAAGVSAIMRAAARSGTIVVPQGAGTGLVGAGITDGSGDMIILSLDRLDRAPVVDAANRTIDVDAGTRLSAINAAAEPHGLYFPIDLGADPSVGGMIAANTGGARFLRYGDVRRNLLGLEVVLADRLGTIVTLGGALWKNNVGIDLKHLFTGTSGSLGIVTRATLALQPRPASKVTALIALADPHAALKLIKPIERSFGTLVTAFEGISGTAMAAAFAHIPRLRRPFAETPPYAVLVELASGPLLSDSDLEEGLATILQPLMERDARTIVDITIDRGEDLWAIRHAVPEGLRAAGRVIACDIALRRGDVMRFRADAITGIADRWPDLIVHDFGHIGDGGLHFNLVWPKAAGPMPSELPDAVHDFVFTKTVGEYGGSFSAEHGIGPRNSGYYTRFVPRAVRNLAGSVQRSVAPVRVGRVDFGIANSKEEQLHV